MIQTLTLADYTISVGDIWAELHAFLSAKNYSKIFALVDENTEGVCFQPFRALFPADIMVIQISSGELNKNIETCQKIWQALFDAKADRKSCLICLGGGVIGDMGGFVASTYKRGIDFVQMPTTLLSQVDSSIGGKLGIDFYAVKNSIGVFANPKAVFISTEFLKTLPLREIRSGFAEIIKHAFIADAAQWETLKRIDNLATVDWASIIVPSLRIKQTIVAQDPFERGIRKALNFGHTIGHAIESAALETDKPLAHGEAIAIGMICEAYLSKIGLGLSEAELEEISRFILAIYGHYSLQGFDYEHLINLMQQDKKNEGAGINFSLLPAIGQVTINCLLAPSFILESLAYYEAQAKI